MAVVALGFFTVYIFIHPYILSSTQKLISYFLYDRQLPGVGDADMNKKKLYLPSWEKTYIKNFKLENAPSVTSGVKQRKSQVSLSYDSPKIRQHILAVFIYLCCFPSHMYVISHSSCVRLFGPSGL